MKLVELKVCPKCGYIRKEQERAPAYECPQCGIIYGKYRPPAPPPEPAPPAGTQQTRSTDRPQKASGRAPARTAAASTNASAVDAALLSVALGVILEPVFNLTRLLKHLGFPGDGALSEVFGGRLASRFSAVEVGLSGTLLSIGLAAVMLFALGAQRSVSLSKGHRVVIALVALCYLGVLQAPGWAMMGWSFEKFGRNIWPAVEDITLTLTMLVLGFVFTAHLIRWSRWLRTSGEQEACA